MENDARRKVLELLVDKNITINDALKLLDALDNDIDNTHHKRSFTSMSQDNDGFELNDAFMHIDQDMQVKMKDLKQALNDVKTKVNKIKNHSTIIIEKKRK